VASHTLDLLGSCQQRTGSLSFPDVATAAFGSSGRRVAAVMCYLDRYAVAVGCMIITSHSLMMLVLALTGYQLSDANSKIISACACENMSLSLSEAMLCFFTCVTIFIKVLNKRVLKGLVLPSPVFIRNIYPSPHYNLSHFFLTFFVS
jgi:hypothetical protein